MPASGCKTRRIQTLNIENIVLKVCNMENMLGHCAVAYLIRLLPILYGEVHDSKFVVKYTDIDYRVFTDAARHMLEGRSPYQRHTYRYTPLLAFLLIPNLTLHPIWGKILFSLLDIVAALLIHRLLIGEGENKQVATRSALLWLYNPLSIVISTRGNADAISSALVLGTLVLLQKKYIILAGALHGLAVHVRLYPIVFSLPMYLSLQREESYVDKDGSKVKAVSRKLLKALVPTVRQVKLVISCLVTLGMLSGMCYYLYGQRFLQESLLYHLTRVDTRHNFSVYFYLQYLGTNFAQPTLQRILVSLPQMVLLLALSFAYDCRRNLVFCLMSQAFVMVTYNPVLTSQYLVWFLSLIPACMPRIHLSNAQITTLLALWLAAQVAWLLPAYWLEFRGQDTFLYIWLQGIAFFCANIAVLARLIRAYQPRKYKEE